MAAGPVDSMPVQPVLRARLLAWAVRAWVVLAGLGVLYLLRRWPGQ